MRLIPRCVVALFVAIPSLAAPVSALANPGYYLVSVYDNTGEKSLDFRYWSVKFPGRDPVIWPEIGFGYGVTSQWYTEVLASYEGNNSGNLSLDTWNWQNDYLLTQGQYPFDLAIHSNIARAHDSEEGYTLELGPALQTEVGKLQLNGNLFLLRNFRTEDNGPTQLNYQWQASYHWRPYLHVGLQGFGELGDWKDWAPRSQQSHRAGPALSGSLPMGAGANASVLKYQAAYLYGSIYARHGHMLTMRMQYSF
jgi:hypothetical protein